jgi:prevent-host-death family protein
MVVNATEFKAKCLALIDRVRETGEPITITKRGKAVARLVPEGLDEKPWLKLRAMGKARWHGDPFAPVVHEREIEALKKK